MNRRGITLTEVLVAIFIMGIGLLTLLTLFPLGALTMAQSLKDDRTVQAAANAAALAAAYGVRNDPTAVTSPSGGDALANPDGTDMSNNADKLAVNQGQKLPPAWYRDPNNQNLDGPSYPVLVDPFGLSAGAGRVGIYNSPPWPVSPGFLRQGVSYINGSGPVATQQMYRWFSLLDDLTFWSDIPGNDQQGIMQSPGRPEIVSIDPITNEPTFEREGRYTWAYLLRRDRASLPSVVDLTVIVYSGRALQPLGETVYQADFDVTTNIVNLSYNGEKPPITKGSWIFDATMTKKAGANVVADPHGFFYRVVDVTDLPGNVMQIELQTNPRMSTLPGQGLLMVFENVVEVFEKGPGSQP